jgi:hypothetical protein
MGMPYLEEEKMKDKRTKTKQKQEKINRKE